MANAELSGQKKTRAEALVFRFKNQRDSSYLECFFGLIRLRVNSSQVKIGQFNLASRGLVIVWMLGLSRIINLTPATGTCFQVPKKIQSVIDVQLIRQESNQSLTVAIVNRVHSNRLLLK